MASVAKKDTATEDKVLSPYDKVEIKLPRASGGEDEDVYVSVNEYSCLIPRGKTVMVPRFVKEELERSEEAKDKFYSTRDSFLEK